MPTDLSRAKNGASPCLVVTGSSSGIGIAVCQTFLARGWDVAGLDLAPPSADAAVLARPDGRFRFFACDVTREADIASVAGEIVDWTDNISALVNGAAPFDKAALTTEVTLDQWNQVIAVILTGALLVAKHVVPAMARHGGGAVVNIASQLGHTGVAGRGAYCAAKAGLINLSKVMAIEYAPLNIRCNSLSLGGVFTERMVKRFGSREEALRVAGPDYLLSRLAEPQEAAEAVWFLATEASSFVTGTDLLVDGGLSIG